MIPVKGNSAILCGHHLVTHPLHFQHNRLLRFPLKTGRKLNCRNWARLLPTKVEDTRVCLRCRLIPKARMLPVKLRVMMFLIAMRKFPCLPSSPCHHPPQPLNWTSQFNTFQSLWKRRCPYHLHSLCPHPHHLHEARMTSVLPLCHHQSVTLPSRLHRY